MIHTYELAAAVDRVAPFATAMEGDNCGLILDFGNAGEDILFALDVTAETLDEAAALGCFALVTHHPALKNAQKTFGQFDPVIQAAARGISLVAAHTCFDLAAGGVNDVLSGLLDILNVKVFAGIGRGGELKAPMAERAFLGFVKERLGIAALRAVCAGKEIRRVAVIGGSGGGEALEAAAEGYDALVTGEVRHNEALAAKAAGICLVAAGHFATENPAVAQLRALVEKQLPSNIRCHLARSGADPFSDYF